MKFKEQIIHFLNRRRIKGLVFLAAALASAVAMRFTSYFMYRFMAFISILCDILALYYIFVTPDMRKRAVKKLEAVLIRFTRGLLGFVRKVMDKFSLSNGRSYRGMRMAGDYRDVSERIEAAPIRPAKKKYKKYKNMDNIEKVRFIYEKKVAASIRKGAELYECMTPNETGRALIEGKYMKQSGTCLIDAYNEARYNSEAVISDETVSRVKEV